jgi:hypothetical protein
MIIRRLLKSSKGLLAQNRCFSILKRNEDKPAEPKAKESIVAPEQENMRKKMILDE